MHLSECLSSFWSERYICNLGHRKIRKDNVEASLASKYYRLWNHLHMLLYEVSMICISFFPIYLLCPSVPKVQSNMPTTNKSLSRCIRKT